MHFELNPNSIGKKRDVNWWRKYWKFVCDYGVEIVRKKKMQIQKDSCPWVFFGNGLNKF
jgi:hypothetical protein